MAAACSSCRGCFVSCALLLMFSSVTASFSETLTSSTSAVATPTAEECAVPAQGMSVKVTGVVTDPSGALLRDAVVTLTCGQTQLQTHTDASGTYTLHAVPGQYDISVAAEGFSGGKQSVTVRQRVDHEEFDLTLNLAQASSTVQVSSGVSGYQAIDSSTATRTDTPIRDIPQAIYVIPAQLLEDEQAVRLQDAVRNVSGVSIPEDAGGRMENITMRGFVTTIMFKDGFRNDGASTRSFAELSNVERIDILKGPSSTVFGRLDPSGVVNLVTKSPLRDPYYSVTMQGGSFQFLRPTVDISGPVTANRSLLYRMIASGQDSGSFRDFNYTRRLFLSPTLTWLPSVHTSLRLYSEFNGGQNLNDRGLIAVGTRPANVPISRFLGDPTLTYPYREGKGGLSLDQALGKLWTFRSYERSSTGYSFYNSRSASALAADNMTITLNDLTSNQYFQTHYWVNEFTGTVRFAKMQHTIAAGAELDYELFDTATSRPPTDSPTITLNLYHPDYAALPPRSLVPTSIDQSRDGYGGGYVEDQVNVTDKLKVTGSLRYDIAKLKDVGYLKTITSSSRATAWSPRVGLVYEPTHDLSLYAVYSRSFEPESGVDVNGNLFKPEYGRLLETGLKFGTDHPRMSGTVAFYQVDLTNVLTADPNNDGFSIQVGAQRSRGIEFNTTTQLTSNWNLIAGYAFDIARVEKDNTYLVGSILQTAPRHTGNLWSQYIPTYGWLRGSSLGAGVSGLSKEDGQLRTQAAPNTYYWIPGYARFDAGLSYDLHTGERWNYRLAVNANNLLDRRYFSGASGRFAVYPGSPRDVIASLQLFRK